MKKFLFISIMFALFVSANAQNSSTQDIALDYGQTWYEFAGGSIDTFGIADSTWSYTVRKRTDKKLTPKYYVALDSVGGTANAVNINAYSKVNPSDSYILREQITWANGNDTTLEFESDTAHHSQYWKLEFEGQDNTFKIGVDKIEFHTLETD